MNKWYKYLLWLLINISSYSIVLGQLPNKINFGIGYMWLDPLIYNDFFENKEYTLDFTSEPPSVISTNLVKKKSYHSPLNSISFNNTTKFFNFDGVFLNTFFPQKNNLDSLYKSNTFWKKETEVGSYYTDNSTVLPWDTTRSMFFVDRNSQIFGPIDECNINSFIILNEELNNSKNPIVTQKINWLKFTNDVDSIIVLGTPLPIKFENKILVISTVVRKFKNTNSWGNWELVSVWITKNEILEPQFMDYKYYSDIENSPLIPSLFWPEENKIIFIDSRIGKKLENKFKVCTGHLNEFLIGTVDLNTGLVQNQNIIDLTRESNYFALEQMNRIGKIQDGKYIRIMNGGKDAENITLKSGIQFSPNYKIMYITDKYGGLGQGFFQISFHNNNQPSYFKYYPIDDVLNFVNNHPYVNSGFSSTDSRADNRDLIDKFNGVYTVDKTINFTYGKNRKLYLSHCNPIESNKVWLSCILYPDSLGNKMGFKRNYLLLDENLKNQWREISWRARKPFGPFLNPSNLFVNFTYQETCNGIIVFNESHEKFVKFKWYFPDTIIESTNKSLNIPVKKSGKYLIKLHGFMSNGYDAWYSDSIYINLGPKAFISALDSIGCQYIKMKFLDSSIIHSARKTINFHWDFGDGNTYDTTITNNIDNFVHKHFLNHKYIQSGDYYVTLIVNDGKCKDSTKIERKIEILSSPRSGIGFFQDKICTP